MALRGFLLVFVVGLGLHGVPAKADTYVVAVNHAPPYRIIEKNDGAVRFSGFYVDFIREVAHRLDFKLTFKDVPFRRALALMERGGADVMVGPNRTPARETFMLYLDEELTREEKALFLPPGAPDVVDYDGLASRRIGVLRGAIYSDRFDKDEALNKVPVAHYANALKMVSAGRLDLVIAPEQLGDYLVAQLYLDLRKAAFRIPGRPSYIAVSRKSGLADMKARMEATLRQMKADGTVDLMIKSYR